MRTRGFGWLILAVCLMGCRDESIVDAVPAESDSGIARVQDAASEENSGGNGSQDDPVDVQQESQEIS